MPDKEYTYEGRFRISFHEKDDGTYNFTVQDQFRDGFIVGSGNRKNFEQAEESAHTAAWSVLAGTGV